MTVDGKVCVLGMWHLGSVTSACLAEKGYTVYGYDERDEVIKSLKSGKAIIDELGLDNLIEKNTKSGNLIFSSSLDECIVDCQTIILASVPPAKPRPGFNGNFLPILDSDVRESDTI